MGIVEARDVAGPFYADLRKAVEATDSEIRLVGILGNTDRASKVYSGYAARGCKKIGIVYEERAVDPADVEREVFRANVSESVHGMLVYYPIFGGTRDRSLQSSVNPDKDVEGLHPRWAQRLYHDERFVDPEQRKKAILPCTPLGIAKALIHLGAVKSGGDPRQSAAGTTVTIFNRSEVVGRPLAAMLAHDGAKVYSFDIDGPMLYDGRKTFTTTIDRATALAESDVVVSGVPSAKFERIRGDEIKAGAVCVNFSHFNNLADDVVDVASHVLPRVGPITVAMLLRNTVRLYTNART
jgi:5,10-methylene-tetrahydrofolate dehydrogenase/methenyl tetrahydrofolate cyclohydrolase